MRRCALARSFALAVLTFLLLAATPECAAQSAPRLPYLDPALPLEQRVDDLVSRLTLEEKVGQMMHSAPPVERLGIPAYNWWSEGLHGVARAGYATVFPQAIGLAATWDAALIHRVADIISTEARAKYNDAIAHGNRSQYYGLTFWSPNINIFRDPRWGRGQETYGEDPYLSGQIGVAFVTGLQGDDPKYLKTVATPKHFAVHSGPEVLRHRFDVTVSRHDLMDTYLPAFRATVVEGRAQSVMCAYNSVLGQPACANDLLFATLRGQWHFPGYVVSDCGAIGDIYAGHGYVMTIEQASALAVKAGADLACGDEYEYLVAAVRNRLLSEDDINTAVKRLFTARFRLGMFDPPEQVTYARIPISENDSPAHRQAALEAARGSIVLLKNTGVLPLRNARRIAVVGPNADSLDILLGNYNGTPSQATTPLDGVMRRFAPAATVTYAPGSLLTETASVPVPSTALRTPDGAQPGLEGEYFANPSLSGVPVLRRIDSAIDFDFAVAPAPQMARENFSVRWTGKLVPPATGEYRLGATADDGVRIYLDGVLLAEDWTRHGARPVSAPVRLQAGRAYDVRIEYFQQRGGASVRLEWAPPDLLTAALEAARNSDVVVAFVGISPRLEGEEMDVSSPGFFGGDRVDLDLPRPQQRMLEALAATGKPIVVVLLNGSALAVNWAQEHAAAVLEAWYPGEEGGAAIAGVLAGDFNPAGRLPVTFYRSVAQLPPFNDYAMAGRTYRYFRGEPLYAFGYGLSYSRFLYSGLKLSTAEISASQPLQVEVTVRNQGPLDGDEVVELYLDRTPASPSMPFRTLQGFRRIHLKAGEQQRVQFTLQPRQLAWVADDGTLVEAPGRYIVSVGGRQPDAAALREGVVVQQEFTLAGAPAVLEKMAR
jgi:beta-glucosidase